jgi:hypothetical protein
MFAGRHHRCRPAFFWENIQVTRCSLLLLTPYLLLGCQEEAREARKARPQGNESSDAPSAVQSGIVVDSALPMDTLVRRFQSGLDQPARLSDGASSRDSLTRRYLDAVARSDTTALRSMHISRSEYAFLYFPASKMMKPPYELPPEVAWLLLTTESGKGLTTVLRRFGGQRLEFQNVRCPGEPLREGGTTVWRDCVVRYRAPGQPPREQPLFAAIIERDGRFKFFSYANTL